MAAEVSNESVWAVVTLVFIWIEFGSSWADDAIFTVPEWEFRWALASLVSSTPNSSGSLLIGRAFALSGGWVEGCLGASHGMVHSHLFEGWVVDMILLGMIEHLPAHGIPEQWGGTLNAVVSDFIISLGAA
jgi:hypothetical protein